MREIERKKRCSLILNHRNPSLLNSPLFPLFLSCQNLSSFFCSSPVDDSSNDELEGIQRWKNGKEERRGMEMGEGWEERGHWEWKASARNREKRMKKVSCLSFLEEFEEERFISSFFLFFPLFVSVYQGSLVIGIRMNFPLNEFSFRVTKTWSDGEREKERERKERRTESGKNEENV